MNINLHFFTLSISLPLCGEIFIFHLYKPFQAWYNESKEVAPTDVRLQSNNI